ncbi:hypothetical protein [Tateyamaria sp. ANG-S1]|uniref:hypothetical protein n=1 Tax=Tateyamaria sp. ANG-S1 TaxID=1577905 RepID=UPI001F4CCE68|nr:hypothetical protein [Tateyamaria sp. ANG-S1]
MELDIASITFEIVEDHDELLIGIGVQIRQQRPHARTLDKITAARDRIGEDHGNLIAF